MHPRRPETTPPEGRPRRPRGPAAGTRFGEFLDARPPEPLERSLLGWLRGEFAGPIVYEMHGEEPVDLVLEYRAASDESERPGIDLAVASAIEAALGHSSAYDDPASSSTARALLDLCSMVQRVPMYAALPAMGQAALHTELLRRGTATRHLHESVERAVLAALSLIQSRDFFTMQWVALWRSGSPSLRPLATAGLRHANPKTALQLLPEIVERALEEPDLPLGDILWAYAYASAEIRPGEVCQVLKALPFEPRQRAAQALTGVGATSAEVAEIVGEDHEVQSH
jgi:hypothetical protein